MKLVTASPAWNAVTPEAYLELGGESTKWLRFENARKGIPTCAGLYAFGLTFGLRYDKGISRIVYIGSAQNLRNRLLTHVRDSHNPLINELLCRFPSQIVVSWFTIPNLPKKWLQAFEGESLLTFEKTFGVFPVYNKADPGSMYEAYCENMTRIRPCENLGSPLTFEELAKRLGRVVKRDRRVLAYHGMFYFSLSEEYEVDDKGLVQFPSRLRNVVDFPTQNELDAKAKNERRDTIERLCYITGEHVAMWSVDKFCQLILLCKQLSPVKNNGSKWHCLTDAEARHSLSSTANPASVKQWHTMHHTHRMKAGIGS